MPNEANYQDRISEYDLDDLLELWQSIEARDTPNWPPGQAFEYLVLRAFELGGAEVRWPYRVDLEGEQIEQIDGVVYTDGLACLVESKDYTTSINVEPLAKMRNQLLRRPVSTIGSIFSYQGFTEPAVTLARFMAPQTILLWNGTEIEFALHNNYMCLGLVAKYRISVEQGLPNYNIGIEGIE